LNSYSAIIKVIAILLNKNSENYFLEYYNTIKSLVVGFVNLAELYVKVKTLQMCNIRFKNNCKQITRPTNKFNRITEVLINLLGIYRI